MQLWGTGGGEALFPGVALMKNNGEHQSCAVQPPPSPPPRASPLGTGGLWGRQAAFSVCSDPHQEPRVTLCWVMAVGQQGWVLVLPMGSLGPTAAPARAVRWEQPGEDPACQDRCVSIEPIVCEVFFCHL